MSEDQGFIDWDKRHAGRVANLRGRILDYLRENDSAFLKDPKIDAFLTFLAESQLRSPASVLDPATIRKKWEIFRGGE